MTHEERVEARREKLENAAARARGEANARFGRARAIGDGIPMGQPILVGHHSERRHRADINRIDTNMRKGVEASKAAEDYQRRADNAGNAISSDDDDAVELLTAKVEKLEAAQAKMKAANKLVKKGDRAGLLTLGFTDKQVEELFTPDFCGRVGFASYAITNNNANIRRIRERIVFLQRREAAPVLETIEFPGGTIREDREDNRLVIEFDQKPDRAMLDNLRSHGFRWSPTRRAHVRQMSTSALWNAKSVVGLT